VGYTPGSVLAEVFDLETPVPGATTDYFWPDGTERRTFMEYQGFIQSGHYRAGLACPTCHLPHGSDKPHGLRRKTSELCLGCHGQEGEAGPVHRAHPKGEASCVDCHMSLANPEPDQAHIHTHTLRFLEPAVAQETGMPSSCTVECHPGKGHRWAAETLKAWRGKGSAE
jgi:predicted CXXCH cytochrome family protein